MLYFSYGSNMSTKRLTNRVPSARPVCIAVLSQHELHWHKKSFDGSAKCDARFTGDDRHFVVGVVYEILLLDKQQLDRCEGLGNGYDEKRVTIINEADNPLEAFTYYATHIDKSMKVYHWYKEHVLRGANEHGLPRDYISAVEQIITVPDPDPVRHEKELRIYRC